MKNNHLDETKKMDILNKINNDYDALVSKRTKCTSADMKVSYRNQLESLEKFEANIKNFKEADYTLFKRFDTVGLSPRYIVELHNLQKSHPEDFEDLLSKKTFIEI
jgi:hypothetical protein